MNDPIAMQLIDSRANLLHESSCLLLRQRLAPLELLEQLPTHSYFQDDVDMLLVFEEAVHLDDVGVVQKLLDFDLSDKLLHNFFFNEHRFINHLECANKASHLLPTYSENYLAKKTLPYLPVPKFLTSSKLSREKARPLFGMVGLFLIQVFFFYSYFEV